MRYEMISADCHIDLCWLPPDLFVTNAASTEWRDRMPHVVDGPKGPRWTTKKGANLGLACGIGAAGRAYEPGATHRSGPRASTGPYAPGKRGTPPPPHPELPFSGRAAARGHGGSP